MPHIISKMLNVHSAGHVPYESASIQHNLSLLEKLKFCCDVLFDVIKILILSVPLFLKAIKRNIFGTKKNIICGQTVLITGGANGIGKALAHCLAKEGCNIVIADIDENAGISIGKELEKYPVKIVVYKVDVAKYSELLDLKKKLENEHITIDILINNAGLMPLLSLREGLPRDIERIVNVNMLANLWTVRIFLKDMIQKRNGYIVTISSMSSLHPLPGAITYTATKFAVTGFTLALEEELRQEGINFIKFMTVHPYFVATRKDLMDNLNLRFPAITAEETATATVKGLINNYRKVVIPSYDLHLLRIMHSLPYEVLCLIRDELLKERDSRVFKHPEKYISSQLYD